MTRSNSIYTSLTQINKMPRYARRRRSYKSMRRKRPLSKAAYYIAKSLDDSAKEQRLRDSITNLSGAAAAVPESIFGKLQRRKEYLQMTGRGGYIGRGGFFKKADKFMRGKIGRTLTKAALPIADAYTGGLASKAADVAGYGAYYNGLFPNDSTAVVPTFDGG